MPIQDEKSLGKIRSKEEYHLLEMKHEKKIVTQMMEEQMHILITFLATTLLTKKCSNEFFFPQHVKEKICHY
jgi:hypothetical protein